MNKKQFGLKFKILTVIVTSLLLAVCIFSYSAIDLFIKDKNAYVFEVGLKRVESVKKDITYFLNNKVKESRNILNLIELQKKVSFTGLEVKEDILAIGDITQGVYKDIYSREQAITGFASEESIEKLSNELQTKDIALLVGKEKTGSNYPYILLGTKDIETETKRVIILDFKRFFLDLAEDKVFKSFLIFHEPNLKTVPSLSFDISQEEFVNNLPENNLSGTRKFKNYLVASSSLSQLKLSIFSVISEKNAFAAANHLVSKSLTFALFVLFGSLALGILLASSVINPINKLKEAAERIGHGDLSTPVEVSTRDEIELLAHSMNDMQGKIVNLLKETEEKARLESEIKVAQSVQDTLFPEKNYISQQLQLHGYNASASECGGDWWSYRTSKDRLFYHILDATGHGVGPALLTSAVASASYLLLEDDDFALTPNDYHNNMNRVIKKTSKGQIQATSFCFSLDINKMKLEFSNAGHPSPYIYRDGKWQKVSSVAATRLGQEEQPIYHEDSIDLQKDDIMFFYTDGISDQKSSKGTKLGERRMMKKVNEILETSNFSVEKLRDDFALFINQYSTEEFDDDITFAFLKIC